ncbi:MAG: type II secretion system protein F [Lachnospiraceae bacterium]|nr:type II secretion system protein F [Lachnospiraceae bacterium]
MSRDKSGENGDGKKTGLQTSISSPWPDCRICYDSYRLSLWEWLLYGAAGALLTLAVDYVFYRDPFFLPFLAPLGAAVPCIMKRRLKKQRQEKLGSQFKDAIMALSSALQTGYSAENAWREAWQEMICIYGEQALITRELEYMVKAISVNETPEQVVTEFAGRSGLPEIESFAQVFCLAKRSSGDLVAIIDSTARTISEKLRVREEIVTLTTAKQLEETIMSLIPAGIILYLNFAFDGFLEVLYTSMAGRGIMTVCLIIYAAAVALGWSMVRSEKW